MQLIRALNIKKCLQLEVRSKICFPLKYFESNLNIKICIFHVHFTSPNRVENVHSDLFVAVPGYSDIAHTWLNDKLQKWCKLPDVFNLTILSSHNRTKEKAKYIINVVVLYNYHICAWDFFFVQISMTKKVHNNTTSVFT